MSTDAGPAYQPMWIVVSIGIAVTCLLYFGTLRATEDSEADLMDVESVEYADPTAALPVAAVG